MENVQTQKTRYQSGFLKLSIKAVTRIGLPPAILILRRGPYPKPTIPLSRNAAFFIAPLLRASSHAAQQKSRPDFRLVGFVTRIGFKPMTPNLEGLCSIQLSYRVVDHNAMGR
jgi:hypothetical protein